MEDFAKRVPAIRLAIKYVHVDVLTWLINEGKLECVNPPDAPLDSRLNLEVGDPDLTTLELVESVQSKEEREFMASLLTTVISIRRFTESYMNLIERDEDAAPIDSHHLVSLAKDMTNVAQLTQLESLAASCLSDETRLKFMLDAFDIALDKELVKNDHAFEFFVAALKHSCDGSIPRDRRRKLKHRARKINMQSAEWAMDLREAVSRLQVASFNQNLRLDGAERSIAFLHDCLVDMQREAAEARDRERFTAIISTVLSSVCGPISHAIDASFNTSDPVRLLHMMMDGPAAEVQRFIAGSAADYMLQPGVHEALQSLALSSSAVVNGLRTAARRRLVDEGRLKEDDDDVLFVVPPETDGLTDDEYDPVMLDESPRNGATRRQLHEVVLDVIAAMKRGHAV